MGEGGGADKGREMKRMGRETARKKKKRKKKRSTRVRKRKERRGWGRVRKE